MSDPNNPTEVFSEAIGAIDQLGAMTTLIYATEAFLSLPLDSMPKEMAQGVLMMFENIMTRVRPMLPKNQNMEHIVNASKQAQDMAARIRKLHGLPPVV